MVVLKEDKKRDIIDFLESRVGALSQIELEKLTERFADETFDVDDIENIIDEMINEGVLEKSTVKMDVVYLSEQEEEIRDQFEHLIVQDTTFAIFFFGLIIYMFILTNWTPFFEFIVGDASISNPQSLTFPTIAGLVGSYSFGYISLRIYNAAQENIQILGKYSQLVYPMVGIWVVGLLGVGSYATYQSQPVGPIVIATIFSAGVIGGVTLWAYSED